MAKASEDQTHEFPDNYDSITAHTLSQAEARAMKPLQNFVAINKLTKVVADCFIEWIQKHDNSFIERINRFR